MKVTKMIHVGEGGKCSDVAAIEVTFTLCANGQVVCVQRVFHAHGSDVLTEIRSAKAPDLAREVMMLASILAQRVEGGAA